LVDGCGEDDKASPMVLDEFAHISCLYLPAATTAKSVDIESRDGFKVVGGRNEVRYPDLRIEGKKV
jgi:hypothetical protein